MPFQARCSIPAVSKAQRRLFAMAAHHPEDLSARNQRLAQLPLTQLAHFARTPEKGLPAHVPHRKGRKR